MAPKRWISIRNIIIYLETKFRPKSEDFCILVVQNGHHSKPKWSPYSVACLTPCKYPFTLKSVHFRIFKIFILVAILKILKTKSTTLNDRDHIGPRHRAIVALKFNMAH